MKQFPIGGITNYSGDIIPSGWVLCDGKNGTPNLTEKIIEGSGVREESYNDKKKRKEEKGVYEGEQKGENVRCEGTSDCRSSEIYSLAYIMYVGNE
ncbi:phage tail protein [Serratia sp. P2ACOL2]|uniref:phage tail protein n=1 Tax=Serratia sp. P2ACOL2 TaxID=2482769 RepID=UPI000EFBE4D1|nr:phage tail protein [Serratia sp. P2ACOL2]AYO37318.1 hypothetical protein EBA31_08415 [Serratia sp. P2ACOL2]